LYLREQYDAQ